MHHCQSAMNHTVHISATVLMHSIVRCDNKVVYRSRCITEPRWAPANSSRLGVASRFLFSLPINGFVLKNCFIVSKSESHWVSTSKLGLFWQYSPVCTNFWKTKINLWQKSTCSQKLHFWSLKATLVNPSQKKKPIEQLIGLDGWNIWASLLIAPICVYFSYKSSSMKVGCIEWMWVCDGMFCLYFIFLHYSLHYITLYYIIFCCPV